MFSTSSNCTAATRLVKTETSLRAIKQCEPPDNQVWLLLTLTFDRAFDHGAYDLLSLLAWLSLLSGTTMAASETESLATDAGGSSKSKFKQFVKVLVPAIKAHLVIKKNHRVRLPGLGPSQYG